MQRTRGDDIWQSVLVTEAGAQRNDVVMRESDACKGQEVMIYGKVCSWHRHKAMACKGKEVMIYGKVCSWQRQGAQSNDVVVRELTGEAMQQAAPQIAAL